MTQVSRRDVLSSSIGMAAFSLAQHLPTVTASAQTYPAKPIRMVVSSVAGGGGDFVGRLVANELTKRWGQPVIVENRPGGAHVIGASHVAKSPADGYTLGFITSSILSSALRNDPSFELERDLTPVALVATSPLLLVVTPSLPASNVQELIALAKSQPGKLNYGTSGVGSAGHFSGELFNIMADVRITHVPYKGSAESTVAAVNGEVDIAYPGFTGTLALMDEGRLRALAVTSKVRVSSLPSVPTIDESGLPGYEYVSWYGVLAPTGVPEEIVLRLNAAIVEIAKSPAMRQALLDQGLEPQSYAPKQFGEIIRDGVVQTVELAGKIGLKVE